DDRGPAAFGGRHEKRGSRRETEGKTHRHARAQVPARQGRVRQGGHGREHPRGADAPGPCRRQRHTRATGHVISTWERSPPLALPFSSSFFPYEAPATFPWPAHNPALPWLT